MLTSFLHFSIGIFAHFSCAKASSSLMFDGLHVATAFFKSHQRFSRVLGFKSGDWDGHSRTFQDPFLNQALLDLAVCLGSLSCWRVQWSQGSISQHGHRIPPQNVLVFLSIHDAGYTFKISSSCNRKTSAHHHWPTSMFDRGDVILLVISQAVLMADIPLVRMSKQFQFSFISPYNKLCSLIQSTFDVPCGQEWSTGFFLIVLESLGFLP